MTLSNNGCSGPSACDGKNCMVPVAGNNCTFGSGAKCPSGNIYLFSADPKKERCVPECTRDEHLILFEEDACGFTKIANNYENTLVCGLLQVYFHE